MSTFVPLQKHAVLISSSYEVKQREFEEQVRLALGQANLQNLESVRDQWLIFDLSQSYWYDLGVLVWLVSLLHKLKRQGNDIQLLFPEPQDPKSSNVWSFLTRWRFFEALSECVDDPVNLLRPEQVPYTRMDSIYQLPMRPDPTGRETFFHSLRVLEITTLRHDKPQLGQETLLGNFLQRFSGKIILSALAQLGGWDLAFAGTFVRRTVGEGLYNSLSHSKGTFANVSMRLDAKNLTLAIADNGVGIPQVLREAFKRSDTHQRLLDSSDSELIKYFTEPDMLLDSRLIRLSVLRGISSDPARKGLGLYYLKSLVLAQGGELRIRSGTACVDFTQSKPTDYDDMLESPGTMLRVVTPLRTG